MTTSDPRSDDNDLLVLVADITGDEYEQAVDVVNDRGGSIDALVHYFTRAEPDRRAGQARRSEVERLPHHQHVLDGVQYWVVTDHHRRRYALYRRPSGQA